MGFRSTCPLDTNLLACAGECTLAFLYLEDFAGGIAGSLQACEQRLQVGNHEDAANDLAFDLDPSIVRSAINILQQVWHLGK